MADRGLAARSVAARILLRVETERAFADALLGETLPGAGLDARDRALATRLVYGTIAWQRRLDWTADRWVRPETSRLDPEVRIALRLGLFQALFSDRVPAHALVDTSVALVARHRGGAARGLVNAVLRRALREDVLEPPGGTDVEAMAIRTSHPDWLVARWIELLGPERAERRLLADNEPAPLILRARGDRARVIEDLESAGFQAIPARYAPSAVSVQGGLPEEGEDRVIQGEASQLVPWLVAPKEGERCLDACAAPGGKTIVLADLASGSARIVATDVQRRGVERVRALARRLEASSVAPAAGDARGLPFPSESFDAVLVDAPCSGTGTLRQHPEIRWRVSPEDVDELAARQTAILDEAARVVRPGGRVVYATCSLLPEENDQVVDRFLATHPDFVAATSADLLPETARALLRDGAFRTFPDEDELDGFYATRLERRLRS